MIFPVPPGIHPSSHLCGCGGILLMPWIAEQKGHALLCMTNPEHDTYKSKREITRNLYHPERGYVEVDIMTGKETGALAIMDDSTALAKVQQASSLGLFPTKDTSQAQLQLLAQVALAYRLDPLMGEIMPYQGKPYITIAGRRRLDASAGHHPSIAFRLLNAEETDYYTKLGALSSGDIAGFCVLTTEHGNTVEGFGRVLAKQRSDAQRGADHLPTVLYSIEMAQKRQERRAREMAYGPVPRPEGLGVLTVLQEGDESNIIEGEGRVVPSDNTATQSADNKPTEPHYGECPVHNETWRTGEYGVYHRDGDAWCRFSKVMGEVFRDAVIKRHGKYEKGEWTGWLKDVYGATWSKLRPEQQLAAIATMNTPPPVEQPAEAPAEDLPE